MLAGGILGLASHAFLQPVYEIRFGVTINVDYSQSEELTEFDLDHIHEAAGRLMVNPQVRQLVFEQAQAEGLVLDFELLDAYLERRQSLWMVRLRYTDPATLHRLAEIWGGTYYNTLQESQAHALKASALSQYLDELGRCAQEAAAGACVLPSEQTFEVEYNRVFQEREAEMALSRGLYPYLLFDYTHPPEPYSPEIWQPVLYRRSGLMLAGMAAGLVVGAGLVALWPVKGAKRQGELDV